MFYEQLKYDDNGLIVGVFQDYQTGEVLTLAWLNREAVQQMWETKRGTVYRRSKGRVMIKGEVSGNVQIVHEILADCDRDALVIKVEQVGGRLVPQRLPLVLLRPNPRRRRDASTGRAAVRSGQGLWLNGRSWKLEAGS